MCGILAVISTRNSLIGKEYKKILQMINHRGPDDEGEFLKNQIYLGHKRLSIIDLSELGRQPMESSSGKSIIIYNGEIYNYIEIKKEIIKNYRYKPFRTESDTEVVLAAYELFGISFLKKLNGMFSIIIFDKENSKIIVARDRFGIKPLYYSILEDKIIFASEIRCILPFCSRIEVNKQSIFDYITLGRVDHFNTTFFRNINRFPAGHYTEIDLNNNLKREIKFNKWWDIEKEVINLKSTKEFKERTEKEHIEKIFDLLRNSITIRLRSDVPVGSCLSGGIDSSSIVCIASDYLKHNKYNIKTYSSVYGSWFPLDETKFIDIIVSYTQADNKKIVPEIEYVNKEFRKFIFHQEEPVTSFSPFTQYLVMKLAAKNHQKVLLDGQGADEIFAGYNYMTGYYLAELLIKFKILSFIQNLILTIKQKNFFAIKTFLFQFTPNFIRNRFILENTKYLEKKFKKSQINQSILKSGLFVCKNLESALIHHVNYKLQHLLRWEDKNSMAFSIESRTPFLDFNLVIYTLAAPNKIKINKTIRKWGLREAVKGIVHSEILSRKDKIGFASPDSHWIRNKNNKIIRELIDDFHPNLKEFFDQDKLRNILDSIKNNQLSDKSEKFIFRLMCLNSWMNIFIPFNTQSEKINP